MSETPSKAALISSLIPAILGFLLALGCAAWAGTRFAQSGSSLLYGLLTGLSFGALFAFGQRVRQGLFPEAAARRRKISAPPPPPKLRPALQAAAKANPLRVEFDETAIRVLRGSVESDSIVWQDIERVVITIGEKSLPMPYWLLVKGDGGLRIPNDTAGLEELLEQCKTALPGYDNDATYQAVINAMGAMQGTFEIWHRNRASVVA